MCVCVRYTYTHTLVPAIESLGAGILPMPVYLSGTRRKKMSWKHLLEPEGNNVLQEWWQHVRTCEGGSHWPHLGQFKHRNNIYIKDCELLKDKKHIKNLRVYLNKIPFELCNTKLKLVKSTSLGNNIRKLLIGSSLNLVCSLWLETLKFWFHNLDGYMGLDSGLLT